MQRLTSAVTICVLGSFAFAQAIPADPEPRWWKGNLHTHTFWSDGNDFPEMVAEWYHDNGYNFLALSDHNVLSQGQRWITLDAVNKRSKSSAFDKYVARFGRSWVETRTNDTGAMEIRLKPLDEYRTLVEERNKFIMIQGEEITGDFQRRPIHINSTNLGEFIPPQTAPTAEETIRKVLQAVEAHAAESGREVLTHLNHPNFGWGVTAEDLAPVLEERFFEVFNGHTGVHNDGDAQHASTDLMWDIINTIRIAELGAPPMYGVATDDSHSYHGDSSVSVPGRGWVMVRARHLSPESLIRAMEAGDFYASTGVSIESIEFDEQSGRVSIRIAAEPGEQYTTRFVGTLRGADLSSEPVVDANGSPIVATRRYSEEIGQELKVVQGAVVSYEFTGQELYVRAIIASDAPAAVPSPENRVKRAWTQPFMPGNGGR